MAKKNKKSKKTAPQEKPKPLVTMADLQAMSDSDDDSALPPEEEWDADAKALKKAIEEGAFDKAMKEFQEGKNNGDDDESIQEVELGDDGSEDDEDIDDDAEKVDADSAEEDEKKEASSEDEKAEEGKEDDDDDDEEDSEEEESEDEHDDSKAKASSKPQHKKSADKSKEVEDESDSDGEEEKNDSGEEDDSDKEEEEEGKEDPDAMNTKALRVVTQGLAAFRSSMPWAESFTVTPPTTSPFAPGAESSLDIHDDLKREVAFYDIALEAALEARKKCQQAKIPFSRPDDFFAEMVKTDGKLLLVWEYCRIRSN